VLVGILVLRAVFLIPIANRSDGIKSKRSSFPHQGIGKHRGQGCTRHWRRNGGEERTVTVHVAPLAFDSRVDSGCGAGVCWLYGGLSRGMLRHGPRQFRVAVWVTLWPLSAVERPTCLSSRPICCRLVQCCGGNASCWTRSWFRCSNVCGRFASCPAPQCHRLS